MAAYIALIHTDETPGFGVSFPDFPGCVTAGDTLEEAHRLAEEALALHIEGMIEDGEALPEPSSLDAVMAGPENRTASAVLVIVPPVADDKCVRVNITLPENVLAEIDRYAQAHGYTRSGFLVRAARDVMSKSV